MRILIAEDSRSQALDLRRRLTALGHDVVETHDGAEAWRHLQVQPERLVISDWMMPEMSGPELCRKIRSEFTGPYTYIILLTAKTRRDERLAGLEAGADDFLPKPIDQCELGIALKTAHRILAAQESDRPPPTPSPADSALDLLTGLRRNPGLLRALNEAIPQAIEDELPLTLIRLELDGWDDLALELEPARADAILRRVADRVRQTCRTSDVAARYSTDGFALLLPGLSADFAMSLAEELRSETAESPDAGPCLSASAGVATWAPGSAAPSPGSLFKDAGLALQKARQLGGDRSAHFEEI